MPLVADPGITRRMFLGAVAAAPIVAAARTGAAPTPVRLGGPIFLKSDDPVALAKEHRRLGLQRGVLPGRVTDRRRPGSRDPRGVQGRERRHRRGRRLAQHARSRPAEARRQPRLRHRADGARRSRRRALLRRHRRLVQPHRLVRTRLEEPVGRVLRPDGRELPQGDRRGEAEADDVLHRDDGMEPAGRPGRVPAADQGRRSAGLRRAHGSVQRHQLAAAVLPERRVHPRVLREARKVDRVVPRQGPGVHPRDERPLQGGRSPAPARSTTRPTCASCRSWPSTRR